MSKEKLKVGDEVKVIAKGYQSDYKDLKCFIKEIDDDSFPYTIECDGRVGGVGFKASELKKV